MARITLSTHWKFQRLARALGSKVLARGVLETIWEPCWVAGDPYCGTSDDIEALCEWTGEKGALTLALLMPDAKGAGFIEPFAGKVRGAEKHYQVHDFLHHCPEYVRRRRERELELTAPKVCVVCGDDYFARADSSQTCGHRCRQKLYRDRPRDTESDTSNADEPAANHDSSNDSEKRDTRVTPRVTPVTLRDSTHTHTHTHTHGTKSKDDSGTTAAAAATGGFDLTPAPPATPPKALRATKTPPPPLDTSPVVLTFPVVGEGGPSWLLHEAQVARWATLYPTLDVMGEARQALAWIEADSTRRKTAGGMTKCLVSWLNRSVDRPHARGSPTLITGSLKTAGNRAALEEVLRRRGHAVD